MNDCITCGRAIRMRSMLMRFNGKQGTNHWLEPKGGGDCPCLKDFCWTKWRADKTVPTVTDIEKAKWNNMNSPNGDPRTPEYGVGYEG
jgi:hypothetical protein